MVVLQRGTAFKASPCRDPGNGRPDQAAPVRPGASTATTKPNRGQCLLSAGQFLEPSSPDGTITIGIAEEADTSTATTAPTPSLDDQLPGAGQQRPVVVSTGTVTREVADELRRQRQRRGAGDGVRPEQRRADLQHRRRLPGNLSIVPASPDPGGQRTPRSTIHVPATVCTVNRVAATDLKGLDDAPFIRHHQPDRRTGQA